MRFLAPVSVETMSGNQGLYLPVLTLRKEEGLIKLENVGEYWDLIQNQWPREAEILSLDSGQFLNGLLGTTSHPDNRSIIDKNGFDLSKNIDDPRWRNFYQNFAGKLQEFLAGDRAASPDIVTGSDEGLGKVLASVAGQKENVDQSQLQDFLSTLITEPLKLSSDLMVDRGDETDVSSDAQSSCFDSGGEWTGTECQCPNQYVLGKDQSCHSIADLESNCKKSGGKWQEVMPDKTPSPICGNQILSNQETGASGNEIAAESFSCICGDNYCLDADGACRKTQEDSDGDKVSNDQDNCSNTPNTEKNQVNRNPISKYYGCSCSQMGAAQKNCPPDQCVGDNWVIYPHGKQECQSGNLIAYSCDKLASDLAEQCLGKNQAKPAGSNSQGSTSIPSSSRGKSNSDPNATAEVPPRPSKDGKGNSGNNQGNNGGDNSSVGGGDEGPVIKGIQGIKEGLKYVYERDKLRYRMIFQYVHTIKHFDIVGEIGNKGKGGGGKCGYCGTIEIDFNRLGGTRDTSELIVHESSHSADLCINGHADLSTKEVIAEAINTGSVGRIKEFPGQKEEIKVASGPSKGMEVMGFMCRAIDSKDIDPKGQMSVDYIEAAARFIKEEAKRGRGPWIYGWPMGGEKYTFVLSDDEHMRIQRIFAAMDKRKCLSSPPPDLPQIEECKGAPEMKIIQ